LKKGYFQGMGMNNKTTGLVCIGIVLLIWGSAFSITKVAVDVVPPFLLAFLRNLVASLILLPMYLLRQKKQPQAVVPLSKIILLGLTGVTLFYTFFNWALVYTSAAAGALIQGIMPVAIALPAMFFLKEKLNARTIAGIILSVGGVFLIGFINTPSNSGNPLLGNFLMILSVFAWAGYTVLAKSVHHADPLMLPALTTIAGTIFLLPLPVIELWGQPFPVIPGKAWAAIIYLGAFSSALSYILYNIALKKLSATQVGNFLNLDPVIGATIAVIFLKDSITNWQIAGAVLVIAGIWLSMEREVEVDKFKS
jgi:drug/metabolite transporter (DMT)-like permease